MKKENYITIQGWMMTDLNLSGNKLLIYALIYGFSQDGKSTFNGSYDYIAKAVGLKRRATINNLKELIEGGFIRKFNRKKGNSYKALRAFKPSAKNAPPLVHNVHPSSAKNAPVASAKNAPNNNIDNNTNTNIAFEKFWELYDYKKSRRTAEKSWNSLTDSERDKAIKAIPAYVGSTNKDGTFPSRKYPATWLNQKCWEDEIVTKKDSYNC